MNPTKSRIELELGTTYVPGLISRQPKLFSPGMLQLISRAERLFTRVDEHLGSSPYLECVSNTFLNLEALSAAIIDGAEIDLMALLLHDMKRGEGYDPSLTRVHASNSQRAIQYRDYIETHNSCTRAENFVFDRASVSKIFAELNYAQQPARIPYRGEEQASRSRAPKPAGRVIEADRIPEYMDDLFKFCNTDYYTPQIQAGLAHFQLEYIRPFDTRTEALGRQVSYMIYAKREFTRNIIVAAGIESIRRIDDPIDNLKITQDAQAKQSPLELWIYHGANMLLRQARMARELEETYAEIESNWRGRVTKVRKDDICDIMLHDMLAHPIINARYVSERCGKTLPAANDALKKLVASGIVVPMDERKRNRYFYAVDVVSLYQRLLGSIMPRGWLPGTELF